MTNIMMRTGWTSDKMSDKIIILRLRPATSVQYPQRSITASDFAVVPRSKQVGKRESMVHSKVSNTSVTQYDPLDPQVSRHSAKQAVVFLYPDIRPLEPIIEVQHGNTDGIAAVESQGATPVLYVLHR
jgi:hypothetical protein